MKCIADAWTRYEHELHGFVRCRTADAQEANDLVQEVFLRAMRREFGLCGIDNPRAWLFRVARNLLIDRYRLDKEEFSLDEANYCLPEDIPTAVDDLSYCLPRVLSELAPDDRQCITLCDIEGWPQQALADHLGLTLPAAKSRLQRARKRLKAQLVNACQVQFDAAGKVDCFVQRPPLEK
jgi:RNA polymerase sigma-70 factor, ECF subfamily